MYLPVVKTLKAIFITTIALLASCQNVEQRRKMQTQAIKAEKEKIEITKRNEVYAERGRHTDNFLYLNYWIGMDSTEFHIITDSLIKAKILSKTDSSFFYRDAIGEIVILGDTLKIFSMFNSGKLYGIELKGLIRDSDAWSITDGWFKNSVLDLYKAKYGKYIVEKPKPNSYTKKHADAWSKTKAEYGTYFRFVQYIWNRKDYYVSITKNYDIAHEEIMNGDDSYIMEIPSEISYISKAFFKSKMSKEILDEKVKELNKNKKNQEAKDLI